MSLVRQLACLILGFIIFAANVSAKESEEIGHFHHVRLNVTDIEQTRKFYETVFGAQPINFKNGAPALYTEKSFILLNKVDKPAYSNLKTSLWHIGWGGVDGPNEYNWWKSKGVEFYTPIQELGPNHYMYLYGPDKEIVEIYTGNKHHRFNHVHTLSSDTDKTRDWFIKALNLTEKNYRKLTNGSIVFIDNVQLIVYPNIDRYRPPEQEKTLKPTDDSTIPHIAFSFRDLQGAYQRMKKQGFDLETEIAVSADHGLPSFFARATDGIRVEFVEAKPIPEGIWE